MKIDSANMHFDSDHSDVDSATAIGHDREAIGPRSWTFRLMLIPPSDEDRTATSRLRFDEDPALPSFHMSSGKPSDASR